MMSKNKIKIKHFNTPPFIWLHDDILWNRDVWNFYMVLKGSLTFVRIRMKICEPKAITWQQRTGWTCRDAAFVQRQHSKSK